MTLHKQFLAFDDRLASLGVPPCTKWWRDNIGEWLDAYESRHVLELWGCVGRGAAKSTALYKLATFFTLLGSFDVPPGERHFAVVLSRLKNEAAKGITIIADWLTRLRVGFKLAGDVLEIDDLPRGIRVVAASVAATSGWRCFFVGKDERSKWPSDGAEEREAEEIDTSAAAMTATHPLAPLVSFGSAWGDSGAFYDAITAGANEHRAVIGPAPTWVAAPHITREFLRRKEPNSSRFAREYECVFQMGFVDGFLSDVVDGCIDLNRTGYTASLPGAVGSGAICIGLDPAFRNDEFVCVVARADVTAQGVPIVHVEKVQGWRAQANGLPLSATAIVEAIAQLSKSLRAQYVFGDQKDGDSLQALFAKQDVVYASIPWTAASKLPRYTTLRALMNDRRVRLPNDPKTIAQLRSMGVKLLPSGNETVTSRGDDDRADAVCLAVTEAIKRAPLIGTRSPPIRVTHSEWSAGPLRTLDEHLRYDDGQRGDWGNGMFGF